jgi:hypothetical protein
LQKLKKERKNGGSVIDEPDSLELQRLAQTVSLLALPSEAL